MRRFVIESPEPERLRPVVTIAALYGAGGSRIGPRVAERLGVQFLDRAIPSDRREEGRPPGSSADADVDEKPPKRLAAAARGPRAGRRPRPAPPARWSASTSRSAGCAPRSRTSSPTRAAPAASSSGAAARSCWRDVPGALHVYLGGDRKARVERVMELARRRPGDGRPPREGQRPGAAGTTSGAPTASTGTTRSLYHLMIDAIALGVDVCVDLIVAAAQARVRQVRPQSRKEVSDACSRPRDTPTRERKSLNGLWRFALDAAGEGRSEGWWRQRLPGSRESPRARQLQRPLPRGRACTTTSATPGTRHVARVPERWRGERIVLRFDAATHRAVVWVDETQVAEHEGGYTPFEADVTDLVEPGGEIRITVVVDNVLTWQSIPPGYVEETPGRPPPALLPRLLQLRGPAPDGLALHDARRLRRATSPSSPAWTARRGPSATRSRRAATTSGEVRVDAARRRGRRGRAGDGRVGRAHRRGRPSVAAGRGLPLRADRRAARRRATTPVDSYSLPVGIRTRARSTAPAS